MKQLKILYHSYEYTPEGDLDHDTIGNYNLAPTVSIIRVHPTTNKALTTMRITLATQLTIFVVSLVVSWVSLAW